MCCYTFGVGRFVPRRQVRGSALAPPPRGSSGLERLLPLLSGEIGNKLASLRTQFGGVLP
eukprot:6115317-Alexandrium_andersonii.AAC.1